LLSGIVGRARKKESSQNLWKLLQVLKKIMKKLQLGHKIKILKIFIEKYYYCYCMLFKNMITSPD